MFEFLLEERTAVSNYKIEQIFKRLPHSNFYRTILAYTKITTSERNPTGSEIFSSEEILNHRFSNCMRNFQTM
ncbi:hypothetical protein JTE90_019351 [Oedothorax gibbosus]|uniref:Uncharacterized protein n=1 Tax=Oedothorax gibbosus TaxID=931172 RepID=A0AAV6UM44_9ARAC|nr:hypothetical protein JTE90_019351 [Oedothorax gibbosus]